MRKNGERLAPDSFVLDGTSRVEELRVTTHRSLRRSAPIPSLTPVVIITGSDEEP